ncbi:MAG TPA: AAA family ATPase [Terriglobia bacterium]|nr:AAA family ATPase [Terriglobia bacterium]
MARLKSITLRGFKTFRELTDFQPGPVTVLIGPNGAGKSNLISFFRLLSWALVPPGQLQEHVAKLGGASAILHDGPERTRDVEAHLVLTTDVGENDYSFRVAYAAGDTFVYTEEKFRYFRFDRPSPQWNILGVGHREPELIKSAEGGDPTANAIWTLLRKLVVHQFHDTSEGSRIRQKWSVEEGRWLKEDAGNLAPFLYRLRQQYPKYYVRILETIRLILPFFAEFELKPEFGKLLLAWRERGTDRVFTASQAADGMLRTMALVALFQQPEFDLPDVVILDEPELGLHPYAIEVLAGLIRSASAHAQVILATQSASLVDRFAPEDIVVVDRTGRESTLQRHTETELHAWLEEYTLSELWEKNVIGGRPS